MPDARERDAAVVNKLCLLEYLLHEARDLIATKKRWDWSARYDMLIVQIDEALGYGAADGAIAGMEQPSESGRPSLFPSQRGRPA